MGDQREEGRLRGRTQLACFWTRVFQIPFKKKKNHFGSDGNAQITAL